MFYDIVRKLPEGAQIVLESSGDRAALAIRAGRSRFTLQTLPESDFPDLAPGDMTHKFTLKASDLKRLIDKTQFAISTEETRYYLNGIYLHIAGAGQAQTLRAVATDGHRLAQMELPLPDGAAGMPGIIVPRKTVGEVQRLLDEPDAEVTVELSPAKIRFTRRRGDPDVEADRRHISGLRARHPARQRQGIDRRQEGVRSRGRPRLDGVERARTRGETVVESGKLLLSVTNPDSGSATEELEVEYEAEPIDIGFNSRYLLDIASQIESEAAVLKLADPGSPTLIQDKEPHGALYVLMPMRVEQSASAYLRIGIADRERPGVPGIHVVAFQQDVDGRDKPGHDD